MIKILEIRIIDLLISGINGIFPHNIEKTARRKFPGINHINIKNIQILIVVLIIVYIF